VVQKKKKKIAFTLIELLVTISIIGILIAVGTVAYSSAQKKARDSRRRGDLKAIQNALEQYYADNTAYPSLTYGDGEFATYISGGIVPTDPKDGSVYNATTYSSSAYTICADLAQDGRGASDADGDIDDICVMQLQE